MEFGVVPEDWNVARIIPVYKRNCNKRDCANYKGISILMGSCERVMASREEMQEVDKFNYLGLNDKYGWWYGGRKWLTGCVREERFGGRW